MRTAEKLAIASTGLLMLGFFFACGSSDEEAAGGGGGFVNKGGQAGSAGAAGNIPGNGGAAGGTIIVTDSSTSDVVYQPDACAQATLQATIKPANILFLIDRTGSMNCNAPPTQTTAECEVSPKKKDGTQPSKWETTSDAFLAALNELKGSAPLPAIGMMLFNNNDQCGVPSTPDVDVLELSDPQYNEISMKLNLVVPKGDTPIVNAMMNGFAFLHSHSYVGNKFVVLLTDGNETCDPNYLDTLVLRTEDAAKVGIRTFVLGAPGSESGRALLSRLAWAGGTASSDTCDHSNSDPTLGDCHIDMTQPGTVFKDALAAALQKVSGEALSCEIEVPKEDGGQAPDPNKVNVKYTAGGGTTTTIPKDEVHPCDQTNQGWQYTDASKTKIVVCGATCDTIKSDQQGQLSVELGCPTEIPK